MDCEREKDVNNTFVQYTEKKLTENKKMKKNKHDE